MKTVQLISGDGSIKIDYLTDLIDVSQFITFYQIQEIGYTGALGAAAQLSDAAIQANVPSTIDETDLGTLKAFASANEYSLKIYETGQSVIDEVDSIATDILTYTFPEQTGAATIDAGAHTVDIEVANGTSVTALVASFTLSFGAAADISDTPQVSGTTANNFTAPVVYTITAEDGSTEEDWTITVTVAP